MSAPPPAPVLQKSVAVPMRLDGPEHDAALNAVGVTEELTTSVLNHALFGNPRPTVTNAQIQAILDNYSLSEHAKSRIRISFPLPAGGFKRKSQTERFSRCVKMVRRTVKPLPGSNKESAAIAICTKTILHKRGRTIKRYSKKRLVTQRKK
jgi:hypothetical protein